MLALAGLILTLGAQGLFAQTGHANITGVVTDSQGAVIAGATVTATNDATGVATPVTTNSAGSYIVIQLIPGVYTITASREGFATQEQTNYTLVAEQNAGVNFTLQPGKVTEKVTVQAGAELVHTETAELGQTINEHAITELPLNGRNPADLVLLTPGTVNLFAGIPGQGVQTYTTFPTEAAASTNGGRQGSTVYLLDGAYNEDNYQLAAAPFPNPDATQEFTVIGNNFDPRYGFAPGGVVSIVTKSGTNNWHGDAFEFYRNGGFNAKDYFTHLTNEVHRNQFGGSLGGPLVKDKLFVFGNFQGTRQSIFNAGSGGFMWTPAMINNGDFSAYCQTGFATSGPDIGLCNDRDSTGTLVTDQIYLANTGNPQGYPQSGVPLSQIVANGVSAGSGTSQTIGYYPFNTICQTASQMTAGGTACQPYAVTPYSAGAVKLANAIAGNLTPLNKYGSLLGAGYPTLNDFNEFTIRTDFNLNDHNRISGRVFDNFFSQPEFYGGNAVASNRSWIVNWQSYAGTWTWTINPHMVNNVTGSYTRMFDHSNSGLNQANGGKGICFSQFVTLADQPATPDCSIEGLGINGGYQSTGGFPGNWQNFNGLNRYTWGISDNLSISKGKHLLVAGIDIMQQYWQEATDWEALPVLGFGGGPAGQFTGNGFSDFLLGDMSYLQQDGGATQITHAWLIEPYVADQIKVKPNLTLSVGLRYEPWIGPTTPNGRITYFVPGKQSTRYPGAPAGMLFPGDAGVPSSGTPSDYTKFWDPRVGLAWQPKALPNTSVRAAFGMYATPIDDSSYNHASELAPFSPAFNWSTLTSGSANGSPYTIPIIPFDHPWTAYAPTGGTDPFPPFASPGFAPGPSFNFAPFEPIGIQTAFSLNYTTGRTYTWNASLEHQFGSNWLARAAYVASESDHQSFQNETNPGLPICGPVNTGVPVGSTGYCAQVTTNPRINPNFGSVDVYYSEATANYQSGQFTLEKKFNRGLQFTANYTYSHTIDEATTGTGINGGYPNDPGCLRCNRGNSYVDIPQVFVANFVYETPAPAGWNRAARLAVGGWQLSGIYRAQSGVPFTIYCGCTSSWQDAGADWAQFASGVTRVHTHPGQLTYDPTLGGFTGYLSQSDFVPAIIGPPQGTPGNTGRNPPGVFDPGVNTWDLGMMKNFNFTERYRFQFRWEMYNAFNRVTFSGPGNGGANYVSQGSVLGLIYQTNGAYPSRVMQGALKFYF